VDARRRLVAPQPRRARLPESPSALQALPHHHLAAERLLPEARADRPLSKQDLENATTFGTSHIDQFTWKQVLDMFSCTECGRCSSKCRPRPPAKPLAPRQLLLDLRDYLYAHQDEVIEKRVAHRDER
jgi:hypothetical protein